MLLISRALHVVDRRPPSWRARRLKGSALARQAAADAPATRSSKRTLHFSTSPTNLVRVGKNHFTQVKVVAWHNHRQSSVQTHCVPAVGTAMTGQGQGQGALPILLSANLPASYATAKATTRQCTSHAAHMVSAAPGSTAQHVLQLRNDGTSTLVKIKDAGRAETTREPCVCQRRTAHACKPTWRISNGPEHHTQRAQQTAACAHQAPHFPVPCPPRYHLLFQALDYDHWYHWA